MSLSEFSRSCGSCSMCCKLPLIELEEIRKPAHQWCKHCLPGKGGCQVYESRPQLCKDFHCLWLEVPPEHYSRFPDNLRPDKSGAMLFCPANNPEVVMCHMDLNKLDYWRKDPLKKILEVFSRKQLVIVIGPQIPGTNECKILSVIGPEQKVHEWRENNKIPVTAGKYKRVITN